MELMHLLVGGDVISLKPGQVLFSEGEFRETMFIILSGSIEVYKESKIIAHRAMGEFFGEMSLLESRPRSASVRAVTDAQLLEIGKSLFFSALANNPEVVWDILKTLSQREREDLDVIESGYRELKKSEEKYRRIVDSVTDIIIQVDPEGKIVFANKAVGSLGYDPAEMVGTAIQGYVATEFREVNWHMILTQRVGSRCTVNLEADLKVNPDSPIYRAVRSVPFLINSSGIWDVPGEMVMTKDSNKRFLGALIVARQGKFFPQL